MTLGKVLKLSEPRLLSIKWGQGYHLPCRVAMEIVIILIKSSAHSKHEGRVNMMSCLHPLLAWKPTPPSHSVQGTLGLSCQARRNMADK